MNSSRATSEADAAPGSLDQAARMSVDAPVPEPGCVVVVRGINYEQLVGQYNQFYGTRQGEAKLRAEYAPIFTEAPKRTGLLWSNFNYDKDRGSFVVESIDAAEALATAILEIAQETNAQIE